MREILFKGKRTDNKGWIEGLLTIMWGQYHIINPSDENTAYPIDPETVCQYTGLTDKNGRKIFEGDILREDVEDVEETGTDKFIYSVQYSDEYCAFATSDVIGKGYFEPLGAYINVNAEVIGSIFDNSELIGEQP